MAVFGLKQGHLVMQEAVVIAQADQRELLGQEESGACRNHKRAGGEFCFVHRIQGLAGPGPAVEPGRLPGRRRGQTRRFSRGLSGFAIGFMPVIYSKTPAI